MAPAVDQHASLLAQVRVFEASWPEDNLSMAGATAHYQPLRVSQVAACYDVYVLAMLQDAAAYAVAHKHSSMQYAEGLKEARSRMKV